MSLRNDDVLAKCQGAKGAAPILALTATDVKNQALARIAAALTENQERILAANAEDVQAAKAKNLSGALIDRLTLTESRIAQMAQGLLEIAARPDPIGDTVRGIRRPTGLEIDQVRVPLGVVGIIYEARPNVTIDAAGLCLKAGNAVVLRGSSDALRSNQALVAILRQELQAQGLPVDAVTLIEDVVQAATEMMRMNQYLDVLIPRGGAGLIQTVKETATVPVIETWVGNCHAYIDASADLDMAEALVINGKCQRPGVCNALETLLVHREVAEDFLPRIVVSLKDKGVEVRAMRPPGAGLSGAAAEVVDHRIPGPNSSR